MGKETATPTIHREAGFRFFFFPNDHAPPHVHVERAEFAARFELRPVRCTDRGNMRAPDLARVESIVEAHSSTFEEVWHDYFGTAD